MPKVKSEHATIYYETCGPESAPALVFAHGRGGNASRMDVLEDPPQSIRGLGLRQRRCHRDPTSRARAALMEHARVTRAQCSEQIIDRVLERLWHLTPEDCRLVFLAQL